MSASLGAILTPMITPFREDGALNEDAAAELIRHLLAYGSDGVVLTGTTGEGATVTDEEDTVLWELGVEVAHAAGGTVIAGAGTNDTRHSIEQVERAAAAGADAALVVAPYYNKPSRAGLLAHYQAVAGATDLPIVAYNIPHRTGIDMPNDLLAELGQIPTVVALKQSRYEDLATIDGLDLWAGNDDNFAEVLDLGGTGGILVAAHFAGEDFQRMLKEPDERHAIQDRLKPLFDALGVAPLAASTKAALRLLGHDVGGPRLPYVDLTDDEIAGLRTALEAQGLFERV